jgi:aminoglycoside phosphotransferase
LTELSMPAHIAEIIGNGILSRNTVGCSASAAYRVQGLAGGGNAYLKILKAVEDDDLRREHDVLKWLISRLPVPRVLSFAQEGLTQYLLMTETPGSSAADEVQTTEPEQVISQLAEALRAVHDVDISACPFDMRLDVRLAEARARIDSGLVDEGDFEGVNMGRSAVDIYRELIATRPNDEELVFTHGDYCLPNIMLKDGAVSGFLDLGRAGVADRYTDLALAARSIGHNTGDERLVDLLFEAYGLGEADWRKVDYYILLDELF